MKPPSQLKIGACDWTIRHAKGISDSEEFLYGSTNIRHSTILLEAEQSASQKRDTLLHETLHACLSHTAVTISNDDEEKLIRSLTPILLGALRDNKRLIAFLVEP